MISEGLPTSSTNCPVVLVIGPISKTPLAILISLITPEDLEIVPVTFWPLLKRPS